MSLPTHLKIAGIDGESTQKGHENEIELLDWNWGVENAAKPAAGSGSATGKAVARALVFTHRYDRASPQLAKACAQGKHLAAATLSARKAGKGQQDFLTVTLKNVLVASVSVSGDVEQIGESVALTYEQIEVTYRPLDARGGLGNGVGFGWNLKTNRVT